MDEPREVTFFRKPRRSKEYRAVDRSRRKLLVGLLLAGQQVTARKLASKAEVAYGTTYDMLPSLVKYGAVKSLPIAKRQHREDFAYALTNDGLALALAISSEDRIHGVPYPTLLQQVFQPNPKDDPVTILVDYVMLNAITRGMTEYVLRFLRTAMTQLEGNGGGEWKKAGLGAIQVLIDERKRINECFLSALANLTEDDRKIVYQYYKGELEHMILKLAQRAHNRELMLVVFESQRDPDNLVAPIGCRNCGFKDMRYAKPMDEVMREAFTKPWAECPKCGKPIKGKTKGTMRMVASLMAS